MVIVRLIKSRRGIVLAICDAELLGNVYKEGKAVLDLKKYRSFFEGETIEDNKEKLNEMISEADSINAVGEESIRILAERGFDTSSVRQVQKIPHLQVYKIGSQTKKSSGA